MQTDKKNKTLFWTLLKRQVKIEMNMENIFRKKTCNFFMSLRVSSMYCSVHRQCLPIQVHFLEHINRLHISFTGNCSICDKAHWPDHKILIQNNNQILKTLVYIVDLKDGMATLELSFVKQTDWLVLYIHNINQSIKVCLFSVSKQRNIVAYKLYVTYRLLAG